MSTGTQLFVSSVPLTAGKDAADWIAALDSRAAAFCTQRSDRHSITLDGVTARQEEQFCAQTYHIIEVVAGSAGRFYLIDLISAGPRSPTRTARHLTESWRHSASAASRGSNARPRDVGIASFAAADEAASAFRAV